MKRILISLLTIIATSSIAVASSQAVFTDTETVENNTLAAGSLDLDLGTSTTLPFSVSNIAPGDEGEGKVTLTSTSGSLDGKLNVSLKNYVEDENGCLEPEISAGDPCGEGDLDLGLQLAMFLDVNQDGVYNQADGDIELEYSGNTNTTSGLQYAAVTGWGIPITWSDVLNMSGGDSVDLIVLWKLPSTWTYPKDMNILQSDSLGFDIEMVLEQL